MNKDNLLKVADEIDKVDDFDMIYPTKNIVGITNRLFGKIGIYGINSAATHLGLRYQQGEELFYAHSMGRDGMIQVTNAKMLIPAAIRYMVNESDINWRRALTAVMMDSALGKDK